MRTGRPPRYPADEMKVMSYRVRPRFVEAVKQQAKARNVSQGELLDRLAEKAGFYGEPSADYIEQPLSGRKVLTDGARSMRIVDEIKRAEICKHPRSMHTILNGGLAKCRCGALRNAAGEWN